MADKAVQSKDGFFSRLNPFKKNYGYNAVSPRGGWFSIMEPFAGAFQKNIEWRRDCVLAYHAIFACITLIASDISKLRIRLVEEKSGIWDEIPLGKFSVLENPNTYQNRIQFIENWIISKLTRGNAYIFKQRGAGGKVIKLHVLNPDLVVPLVSDSGDVFYQLTRDDLTQIEKEGKTVPASEIIHDRFNCLFHPLVGLSPIFACGLAAYGGIKIQENSARLYKNGARPVGILTAPGAISDETAARLKASWESNYGGENYGKTAVLGDDLKYQALSVTAEESQMVEQLRLDAEIVCSTFHVPRYKVIGDMPSFNNVEAFETQYYGQCLQVLIESVELCLDKGLEIPEKQGSEFDLDGLLRMDTKTQVDTLAAGVGGGIMTPNYALRKLNQKPLVGGDTVYLQQQQFSLEALSKRDALDDPFNTGVGDTEPVVEIEEPAVDEEKQLMSMAMMLRKELKETVYHA